MQKRTERTLEDISDEAMARLLAIVFQVSSQNYRETYRDLLEVFLINKARLKKEQEAHMPPINYYVNGEKVTKNKAW